MYNFLLFVSIDLLVSAECRLQNVSELIPDTLLALVIERRVNGITRIAVLFENAISEN